MKSIFTLKEYFYKYKNMYILGILWLVIVDGLQLTIPKILGRITDALQANEVTKADIVKYALAIVLISILVAFFRFLWRMYIIGGSRYLEYDLRNRFFSHLQTLSREFYDEHKTGDLMAHATNDINAIRMATGPGIVMLIDAIFLFTAIIILMIKTIDVKLTIIALMPLPFMIFTVTRFGRIIHNRFMKVQEAFSRLTEMVQENIAGIRVIKSFVQESQEIKEFDRISRYNVEMNVRLIKVWGFFFPLIQFLSSLSFMLVLGYGGIQVIYGDISLGDFIAFNSYLLLLLWPMMALGWVINLLQRGAASMDRVNTILNISPGIKDDPDVEDVKNIEGSIRFNHLTFPYKDNQPPALKDINIEIPPGYFLGIVGRVGSGKSTLVKLLLRIYKVGNGEIFIDGKDINRIPLRILRENIGYVPQESFLFSTTVGENISLGNPEASTDQITAAAKIAHIYEDILDFPKGFDTPVGERGITLSGGQKQRIALARALIKDPEILILDDALSAVDTSTEEAILKDLKDFMKDKTSIVISHRISTIKDADEIIFLEEGSIAERGNHQELLNRKGLYYRLYQKQLLEEKLELED